MLVCRHADAETRVRLAGQSLESPSLTGHTRATWDPPRWDPSAPDVRSSARMDDPDHIGGDLLVKQA